MGMEGLAINTFGLYPQVFKSLIAYMKHVVLEFMVVLQKSICDPPKPHSLKDLK